MEVEIWLQVVKLFSSVHPPPDRLDADWNFVLGMWLVACRDSTPPQALSE
jgi:hypothetical protein